jgi:hypothetical protein
MCSARSVTRDGPPVTAAATRVTRCELQPRTCDALPVQQRAAVTRHTVKHPRLPRGVPPWLWQVGLGARRQSASDYPVARSRLWHKCDRRNVRDRGFSPAPARLGFPHLDRRPCNRNRRSCVPIERTAVSCRPLETLFCEWTSHATASRRLTPRLCSPSAPDVSEHQDAHRWSGLVQEQDDRSLIVPFSNTLRLQVVVRPMQEQD